MHFRRDSLTNRRFILHASGISHNPAAGIKSSCKVVDAWDFGTGKSINWCGTVDLPIGLSSFLYRDFDLDLLSSIERECKLYKSPLLEFRTNMYIEKQFYFQIKSAYLNP